MPKRGEVFDYLRLPLFDERVGERLEIEVETVLDGRREIMSREALLRALGAVPAEMSRAVGLNDMIFPCGLAVLPDRRDVTVNGSTVQPALTRTQFAILSIIAADPNVSHNRADIWRRVHGQGYETYSSHVVDVHLSAVRQALGCEKTPGAPNHGLIETVRGEGFIMGERAFDPAPLVWPLPGVAVEQATA